MIIRGIVNPAELEQIRSATKYHSLTEGIEGEFRTWTEESDDETLIWLEIDVNEALLPYLQRTGFFAIEPSQPVMTLVCPKCGNANLDQIDLQIDHTCHALHQLCRAQDGRVYAKAQEYGQVMTKSNHDASLRCRCCYTLFSAPGIPLL